METQPTQWCALISVTPNPEKVIILWSWHFVEMGFSRMWGQFSSSGWLCCVMIPLKKRKNWCCWDENRHLRKLTNIKLCSQIIHSVKCLNTTSVVTDYIEANFTDFPKQQTYKYISRSPCCCTVDKKDIHLKNNNIHLEQLRVTDQGQWGSQSFRSALSIYPY